MWFLLEHLATYLLAGLLEEGSFVLEFVMQVEDTEAKAVRRVVKGHLHVGAVLGDVQVLGLLD